MLERLVTALDELDTLSQFMLGTAIIAGTVALLAGLYLIAAIWLVGGVAWVVALHRMRN